MDEHAAHDDEDLTLPPVTTISRRRPRALWGVLAAVHCDHEHITLQRRVAGRHIVSQVFGIGRKECLVRPAPAHGLQHP